MPPKRKKTSTLTRRDVADPASTALAHRPHHLVSRLRPQWGGRTVGDVANPQPGSDGRPSPILKPPAPSEASVPVAPAAARLRNPRQPSALVSKMSTKPQIHGSFDRAAPAPYAMVGQQTKRASTAVSTASATPGPRGGRDRQLAPATYKRTRSFSSSPASEHELGGNEVDDEGSGGHGDDVGGGVVAAADVHVNPRVRTPPSNPNGHKGCEVRSRSSFTSRSVSASPSPSPAVAEQLPPTTENGCDPRRSRTLTSPELPLTSDQNVSSPSRTCAPASPLKSSARTSPADIPESNDSMAEFSRQQPLFHATASTMESNMLFADDDENHTEEDNADAMGAADANEELPSQQILNVLGDSCEKALITPIRPQPARSRMVETTGADLQGTKRGAGRANEEPVVEKNFDVRLLDEQPASAPCASRSSTTALKPIIDVHDQGKAKLTRKGASVVLSTPPPLRQFRGGDSPPVFERRLRHTTVTPSSIFSETLAIQDLTLLADEEGERDGRCALADAATTAGVGSNGTSDDSPALLSSMTGGLAPVAGAATAALEVPVLDDGEEASESPLDQELLLGDGFVSPPLRRVTATPRGAVVRAAGLEVGGVGAAQDSPSKSQSEGLVEVEWRHHEAFCESPAGSSTAASSSPLATPHLTADTALLEWTESHDADGVAPPAPQLAREALSPSSSYSSLSSTQDDGLWKRGADMSANERTALSGASSFSGDARHPSCGAASLPSEDRLRRAVEVPDYRAGDVIEQETSPMDPFLCTPPQFRRRSSQPVSALSSNGRGSRRVLVQRRVNGKTRGSHDVGYPMNSRESRPTRIQEPPLKPTANKLITDGKELVVGTRVEVLWGRQWFPAVVREAPQSGYLQIAWEEDGSLLHVRLREVRLRRDAPETPMPAGEACSSSPIVGETTKGEGAVADQPPEKAAEGVHGVLTATQLVALMDAEDAEESHHELEKSSPPSTSPNSPRAMREATAGLMKELEPNAYRLSPSRKRSHESVSVERQALAGREEPWETAAAAEEVAPLPQGPRPTLASVPAKTPHGECPAEVPPSALCLYFPPAARVELIRGSCAAPTTSTVASVGPATEQQRITELQRILHFLTMAGASVVDSLAQADNIAADLGQGEVHETPFTYHQSHKSEAPPTRFSKRVSTAAVSSTRRRTVGRALLPHRTTALPPALTSGVQLSSSRYFIFLVPTSAVAQHAVEPSHHLSEVCLAHAIGVSAIRASWLWSITPGTPHVKLPTQKDQVELSLPRDQEQNDEPSAGEASLLPLRLEPLAPGLRWLSGKDVAFLGRDDRMEMWLNAAGAVITAEQPRVDRLTSPARPADQPLEGEGTDATAQGVPTTRAPSTRHTSSRQRSASPAHSLPRTQTHPERHPDYVYLPAGSTGVLPGWSILDALPVVGMSWLMKGIEQHYRHLCNGVLLNEVELDVLPLLGSLKNRLTSSAEPTRTGGGDALLSRKTESSQSLASAPQACAPDTEEGVLKRDAAENRLESREALRTRNREEMKRCSADGHKGLSHAAHSLPGTENRLSSAVEPVEVIDDDVDELHEARVEQDEQETLQLEAAPEGMRRATSLLPVELSTEEGCVENRLPAREAGETEGHLVPPLLHTSIAGTDVTMLALLPGPLKCAAVHPPFSLGEDYYFQLLAPAPAHLPPSPGCASPLLQQQQPQWSAPSNGTALTVSTPTIALGRVMDVRVNAPPPMRVPLNEGAHLGVNENSFDTHVPCCRCTVLLRLYEPAYVSMHVDPRTREVVQQTTVRLSQQWATVPGSSLLFDTPVYVISTAVRQHIYLLEDETIAEDVAEGKETVPRSPVPPPSARWPGSSPPLPQDNQVLDQAVQADASSGERQRHHAPHVSEQACSTGNVTSPASCPIAPAAPDSTDELVSWTSTGKPRLRRRGGRVVGPLAGTLRVLPQLPLRLGSRKVVLRPGSHISFYPRRALSSSYRPPLRPRSPTHAGLPAATYLSGTGGTSMKDPCVNHATSGDDSDASEELIAEAPLVGRIELMREMDGGVDILVLTPQPNSVFGGSKMYRITPDMILDVSP